MTGPVSDLLAKTVASHIPDIDWQSYGSIPDAMPQIQAGTVHLWRSPLSVDADWLAHHQLMLSSDEQERAARFKFDHHRQRFMAARCRLRQLLAGYLAIAPEQIQFGYGSHGKPLLAPATDSLQPGLSFNLTHTDDWALYAFTLGCAIGVDIERVRPMPDGLRIAQRFFTPAEAEAIAEFPAAEHADAFFTLWTLKEAYLKAKGEGLVGLQSANLVSAMTVSNPASNPLVDWTIQSLIPISGYQGAIAYKGREAQLNFFTLDAGIRERD
ncbi:MAG: 4'-phosphopantetheinyl transferase superfamily protein [Elainellaceae cyanobacterium]